MRRPYRPPLDVSDPGVFDLWASQGDGRTLAEFCAEGGRPARPPDSGDNLGRPWTPLQMLAGLRWTESTGAR
jgi:hypothetical protein